MSMAYPDASGAMGRISAQPFLKYTERWNFDSWWAHVVMGTITYLRGDIGGRCGDMVV
jgi:hypothetical protein